jgi:hypothetical protein
MDREFIPYELALELKKLGFEDSSFGRFYTKPNCKMFNVDEKGRAYPIKNISKKLYKVGEDYVLNDENVIVAPTYSEAFRWFREKHNLIGGVEYIGGMKPATTWWDIYVVGYYNIDHKEMSMKYQPYEEAELACLKKLIEIVKNK